MDQPSSRPSRSRAPCGGWHPNCLILWTIFRRLRRYKAMCIRLGVSCYRYVTRAPLHLCYDTLLICWDCGKILTGSVPYPYLPRNEQVVFAIAKGMRPRRPDEVAITDRRWEFVEWCWSPMDGSKPRPCSDEITRFTGKELAEIRAAKV